QIVSGIVAREGLRTNDRRVPKGDVLADIFSYSVNTRVDVGRVLRAKFPYFAALAEQIDGVGLVYWARKKETNTMDFYDLLSKTLELFETAQDVAELYR